VRGGPIDAHLRACQVRVISTVSGGSIVAALLYMRLKDLLEHVPDEEIGDEHYVAVVERVAGDLRRGVQRNLRARTFADLRANLRMSRRDYSRTSRMGELYDRELYRPAVERPLFGPPPGRVDRALRLSDLLIQPAGAAPGYDPTKDTGMRRAPVPILVINATSLNTGHNWRFEAIGMGEPDRDEDAVREIDRNEPWSGRASRRSPTGRARSP
jgi:NTE family protein